MIEDNEEKIFQLDKPVSSSRLSNILGISPNIRGGFIKYSTHPDANYVRYIEETDYSISLNYFAYVTDKLSFKIKDYGENALSHRGKSFYQNGKNPNFALTCGDNYIDSCKRGVFFTIALNINFNTPKAKDIFHAYLSSSIGDIVSAIYAIKDNPSYVNHNSVTLSAYQIGGNTLELAKLFDQNSTNHYHTLKCTYKMVTCRKTAEKALEYARSGIALQLKNKTKLARLGVTFSSIIPISRIGLVGFNSINQEILRCRKTLSTKLAESEYYQRKLYPFFHKLYPIGLHKSFMLKANSLFNKASANLDVLTRPFESATDCWDYPEKCHSLTYKIEEELHRITTSDLKFLDSIKYILSAHFDIIVFGTGSETDLEARWNVTKENVHIRHLKISDYEYSYGIDHVFNKTHTVSTSFRGHSRYGSRNIYNGTIEICENYTCHKELRTETKRLSPYFFEIFSPH